MVKNVEYYIGIVGGLFGILDVFFYGKHLRMLGVNSEELTSFILLFHVIAFLMGCFVAKVNAVLYGFTMFIVGATSLWVFASGLYVPAILEIISGGLAFRKVVGQDTA